MTKKSPAPKPIIIKVITRLRVWKTLNDRVLTQKIFDKVEKYLVKDPRIGKPLVAQYKGLHGYRLVDIELSTK